MMDFLTALLSFGTNHLELVVGFVGGVIAGHAVPWLYTSVVGLFSSATAATIESDVATAVNTVEGAVSGTTTTTPAATTTTK